MSPASTTIASAIIQAAGSIAAAGVIIYWYYRHERWKLRQQVVASLWATRGAIAERPSLGVEKEFEKYLNAVPVLWSSDKEVMKLWREVQFIKPPPPVTIDIAKICEMLVLLAKTVGWKDAEAFYVKAMLTIGATGPLPPVPPTRP